MNVRHWQNQIKTWIGSVTPKLPDMLDFARTFAKNPASSMTALPEWEWPEIVLSQAALAAGAGFIGGLTSRQIGAIVFGPIITPITNALLVALGSGVIYYALLFVFEREDSFRRIYMNVFFASLPTLLITTITPLFGPLIFLGLVGSLMLLRIALVQNFNLPLKFVKRVLGGVFIAFFLFWLASTIRFHRQSTEFKEMATPESLDILEKELNL